MFQQRARKVDIIEAKQCRFVDLINGNVSRHSMSRYYFIGSNDATNPLKWSFLFATRLLIEIIKWPKR